jgi:hypothetical protein
MLKAIENIEIPITNITLETTGNKIGCDGSYQKTSSLHL